MEDNLDTIKVVLNNLNRRVAELEADSHPPIGLCEFDCFKELVERIEQLENILKNSGNG